MNSNMNVKDIPYLWVNNKAGSTKINSFSTDGNNLYSYKLKIGYTNHYGQKVVLKYTTRYNNFVSTATSRHVNLASYHADLFEAPS